MATNPGNQEYQGESGRTRAEPAGGPFAGLPGRLTFTVDVEADGTGPDRAAAMTARLLDMLAEARGRATFFVVGSFAEAQPGLVRAIAAAGHEVASHGQVHRAVGELGARGMVQDLVRSRAVLEDLAGVPVLGYRAPMFSVTASTPWAGDALAEAGFAYSSSVLPARNWLHGWPGAPRRPFLWPSGVLEVPVPVARLGPYELPVLGGMYLRYIPSWDLRRMARRLAAERPDSLWTYCHPYDLDTEAPFARRPEAGWVGSLFLWMNRGVMAGRLRSMLAGRESHSFAARLDALRDGAGVFNL